MLSVIVGFFAGKLLKVERDSIAHLLFYFVAPIVFFAAPASVSLTFANISITITVFFICSFMCLVSYFVFGFIIKDNSRSLISFSAGTSNCGYFMLPVAVALFDEYLLSLYMMCVIGVSVFESSVGFYICMSSTQSLFQSIKRIFKLPNFNAFIWGSAIGFSGIVLPEFLEDFVSNMRGTYSVLGMVLVGLGISTIQRFSIDIKFTVITILTKVIFQPLVMQIFIFFDKYCFHMYDPSYYKVLCLFSLAPIGSNTIVMASLMKFHPEKVATAVLLSGIVNLFYIPIMVSMFMDI
jgi:predicted permease